ncbi:MAG: hypothetical protein FWD59_06445 [Micrococcales bacterium]|nr:hypothetical protein [Micrococcales bacterium]
MPTRVELATVFRVGDAEPQRDVDEVGQGPGPAKHRKLGECAEVVSGSVIVPAPLRFIAGKREATRYPQTMTDNAHYEGQVWLDLDLPVLIAAAEALAEAESGPVTTKTIAGRSGFVEEDVSRALARLGKKHVETRPSQGRGDVGPDVACLTADGLEAVGTSPSGQAVIERLIASLDATTDEAPADSPRPNKLKAVIAALGDAGTEIIGSAAGQTLNRDMGAR